MVAYLREVCALSLFKIYLQYSSTLCYKQNLSKNVQVFSIEKSKLMDYN